MRRIILTTGGTGGHIFPALAVAEELHREGAECLFVGSAHGPEAAWAARAGLPFKGLPVRGVLGRGLRAVAAMAGMVVATGQAMGIVRTFRPDVVAGFGAYASCPTLAAAALQRVPILVHEQNAFPGLTNRLMGKLAQRVCLSMPDSRPDAGGAFVRERCVLTGNPVRAAILRMHAQERDDAAPTPHLLIVGGSQGAKAINSLVVGGLRRLMAAGVAIRHQTGQADAARVMAGYTAFGCGTEGVSPFIDDMAEAYSWADVVICRAGASTVAELAVAGKPALYIPFPFATHDHQTSNARAVEKAGAALLVAESQLADVDVIGLILGLLTDSARLARMRTAAHTLAMPDAAKQVAREILTLCR